MNDSNTSKMVGFCIEEIKKMVVKSWIQNKDYDYQIIVLSHCDAQLLILVFVF